MNERIYKLCINDNMNVSKIEIFFNRAYEEKKECIFVFDIQNINIIKNFEIIYELKDILEKNKEKTKRYLIKSIIYIPNVYIKSILEMFCNIIKSEKPIIFKMKC